MEERQRIKNTVYNDGTKEIEQAKVEERLRELGITIRLDSFVDQATEKRVANVVREMMPIGTWSGKLLSLQLERSSFMQAGTEACAVLLQQGHAGPIIGAAMLRDF